MSSMKPSLPRAGVRSGDAAQLMGVAPLNFKHDEAPGTFNDRGECQRSLRENDAQDGATTTITFDMDAPKLPPEQVLHPDAVDDLQVGRFP